MAFLLLAVVVLPAAAALAGYGFWSARKADQSQAWEMVKGELLSREIIEKRHRYGVRTYQLAVRYAYEVAGQRFEGRRLCFGEHLWQSQDELNVWLEENQPDGRVEVFYDPSRPADSVLMPGRAGAQGFGLMVIFGGLWCLVSIALLIQAWSALR